MIPTLATARLTLVPPEPVHFAANLALASDPRVMAEIGPPRTRPEAWLRFAMGRALWEWCGHGFWSVLAGDTYVGSVGIARFERGLPELDGVPEAAWMIAPDWWGQGIASEAVAAMLRWADATLPAVETRCIITPANLASIGVARRVGYAAIGSVDHAGTPCTLFARARSHV